MEELKKYYNILELEETATEQEIKDRYILLKRRYDPENYEKEDLKKHAQEKTKEITDAFDIIMNKIRAKKIENKTEEKKEDFEKKQFKNIEDLIEENQLQKAEDILMNIPEEQRSAHWYFLRGAVLYKKGWLMEASNFFLTASSMDPQNEEYKKAYEKAQWQINGGFNNKNQNRPYYDQYPQGGPMGCSFCDICSAMICMDMCCECGAPRGPYRCI